jgi:hypothetical protein
MIYDVLVHLLSIEDMRRCGPDGWLLFYSFHTTMGVADADQEVAAPLRQEAERGAEEQLHRAPPRNRSNEDDDDDDVDDRGGRAFAPQRRSLFQRLRWPSNKGHGREHSPRRSHGESSRHGGRRHDRERSLSPATHRSRECSLDRFNLYFNHQEKADEVDGDENAKKKGPRRHCKPLHPSPWGKPGAGPAGAVCTPPAGDELESRMPEEVSTFNPFDPMLQEAALQSVVKTPQRQRVHACVNFSKLPSPRSH